MDFSHIFSIGAAGMHVERTRVEVAALNLANGNTVAGPGASPYRPLRVLAQPSFGNLVSTGVDAERVRVETAAVEPRRVYEPGHPMADGRGFVTYAGVDTASEMLTLMSATRAYEANVAVINTTRTMALKALEIGGGT